jgi:hypothetical protein
MENYTLIVALDEIKVLNMTLDKALEENNNLKKRIKLLESSLNDAVNIINEATAIIDNTKCITEPKWMYNWGIIGQITEH